MVAIITENEGIVNREKAINAECAVSIKEVPLSCAGGDMEFYKEVVTVILKEFPKSISDINEAIGTGNAVMLHRSAHKLKGSISNLGDLMAGEILLNLELMGSSGDLTGAEESFDALIIEMESLRDALQIIVEGNI
jgi:hypothetical protein